jgi:hypothetical protein
MEALPLRRTANGLVDLVKVALPPAEQAVLAAYDLDYALSVARQVAAFGEYERGFRPAGSEAADQTAAYLAAEMRRIGLHDVEVLEFPVDGWSFQGARVEAWGGPDGPLQVEAVAYGGANGTPPEGIAGELIFCGTGAAADYAGRQIQGKIALVEMEFDRVNWAAQVLLEAHHQGAAGVICWPKDHYAQREGAFHTHDLQAWAPIPIVNVSREAGERLKGYTHARLISTAKNLPSATGRNVVGYIPGTERPDEIVIIGDHYDAWFHGFLDDAVGVGGVLSLAKAMLEAGYRPRRTLAFVLHDAEEYGVMDSPWDWCSGAWAMVTKLKPDWAGSAVGAVIYELCGYQKAPALALQIPPEMAELTAQILAQVNVAKAYPEGAQIRPAVTCWEDSFSYTAGAGIPTVANLEIGPEVRAEYYHSQFDTEAILDPDRYAVNLTVLALAALRMDRERLPPVDLGALVRALQASLPANAPDELTGLIDRFLQIWSTLTACWEGLPETATRPILRATATLNRGLTWLGGEASDETIFPHQQLVADLDHLKAGRYDRVTGMGWGQWMSYPVYRRCFFRQVDEPERDWGWAHGRVSPPIDCWHLHKERRPAPPELIREVEGALAAVYQHEIRVLREAMVALAEVAGRTEEQGDRAAAAD